MSSYRSKLTDKVVAPKTRRDFTKDWARRILVDYMCKTDPDWLLGDVLKVIDVTPRDNPHPGMLSDSYVVEVTYKQGEEDFDSESWFVKVPKSNSTALKDEVEVMLYNKMFPLMQDFADLKARSEIQMPTPIVFHAAFDEDNMAKNHIVMENLRDQGYRPLRPETCGIVFMRAAMTSLATVHATAYAYQHELGGKAAFLSKFPFLTEDNMPRSKRIKDRVESMILPYLFYMGNIQPDLQPQLALLTKFHKFLLGVYHTLRRDKELNNLKILIHGDSKIDNFMFKKAPGGMDDQYIALIIDWQGACYDLLSGDLMWTLYGFMKNLPDKNSTVDTFLDYSISVYHQELIRILRKLKVDPDEIHVPTHEYDAMTLIKKGFVKEFLQTVIIKPLIMIRNPDLLLNWFNNRATAPVPKESEIFKSGAHYVSFIHLYFTISTEIGVFHDLASLCIAAMKEFMFGKGDSEGALDDTDDEWEREQATKKASLITDEEKAELAKILGQNFTPAPVTSAAPETLTPAPAMDVTPPSVAASAISNEFKPEIAAVSSLAEPPLLETQPDVSLKENGETPSTQPEMGCNVEEEVVSGVVYIRLNSQNHVTTEPEIVPEISDSQQTVPITSDIVLEIPAKVREIEPVEVMVVVDEQPPAKTVKKRKKKTSAGSGIRNRANKAKEVQTIQAIDQKMKGVE